MQGMCRSNPLKASSQLRDVKHADPVQPSTQALAIRDLWLLVVNQQRNNGKNNISKNAKNK
jgi:hypothetical protein